MKVRLIAFWVTLFFLAQAALFGQALEVVPAGDLQTRKAAMEQASEAWHKADRNLEREILRESPAKALARIDDAAQHAHAFFLARDTYLEAFISRLREESSMLNSAPPQFEAAEFQSSIRRKLQTLAAAKKDVTEHASAEPDERDPQRILDSYEAQVETGKLEELRKNLKSQAESLDQATAAANSLEEARSGLAVSFESLLGLLTVNAEQAKSEGSKWENYYETLRNVVSQKATFASKTKKKALPR